MVIVGENGRTTSEAQTQPLYGTTRNLAYRQRLDRVVLRCRRHLLLHLWRCGAAVLGVVAQVDRHRDFHRGRVHAASVTLLRGGANARPLVANGRHRRGRVDSLCACQFSIVPRMG